MLEIMINSTILKRMAIGLAVLALVTNVLLCLIMLLTYSIEVRSTTSVILLEGSVLGLIALAIWASTDVSPRINTSFSLFFKEYLPKSKICYIIPKDDELHLDSCDDRYAPLNMQDQSMRYAVTDGVGRTLCSPEWAQIIAMHFVNSNLDWDNIASFRQWLDECRQEWDICAGNWIYDTRNAREKRGITWDNFDNEKVKGAQTTLIGCSFYPEGRGIGIDVVSVGDANFFLVHPPPSKDDPWTYEAFPFKHSDQFSSVTAVLGTPDEDAWVQYAFRNIQKAHFIAQASDFVVLTSDTLAAWILAEDEQNENPWERLIPIYDSHFRPLPNEEFKNFVKIQREDKKLEDDVTLFIISLES